MPCGSSSYIALKKSETFNLHFNNSEPMGKRGGLGKSGPTKMQPITQYCISFLNYRFLYLCFWIQITQRLPATWRKIEIVDNA